MSAQPSPIVAAATVVLLRDGAGGAEVLLLRRSTGGGAFAGMWVFPGGKVDPADAEHGPPEDDPAAGPGPGGEAAELAAARRAASREAQEEAGLLVDPDELVVHSHWLPPPEAPRRFSTWFFLAPVAGGGAAGEVVVDGHEVEDHLWCTPADAMARRDAGELGLAPPTFVTLALLAGAPSAAAAVADARALPEPLRFHSRVLDLGAGVIATVWPGDVAYEGGDPHAPGPRHRLEMGPAPWRYEAPA